MGFDDDDDCHPAIVVLVKIATFLQGIFGFGGILLFIHCLTFCGAENRLWKIRARTIIDYEGQG